MPLRSAANNLVVSAWLAASGLGIVQLLLHTTGAGEVGVVQRQLPADLAPTLRWTAERPLLLVVAHPQCTCLPSTLDELRAVLADAPALDLRVLVFEPGDKPDAWDPAARDTIRRGLPADTVLIDRGGALAERLGARTSGHIFVYTDKSQLVFSGGITAGRGHRGENAAAQSLRSSLRDTPHSMIRTAVFGCPLDAPR